MNDIFQKLLDDFATLPKTKNIPTYLERCRYPRWRFEEVCSRLLCYYFDPAETHDFGNLFLSSLFQLLKCPEFSSLDTNRVRVENEVFHNDHFLDILIETPVAIIGIENKITAELYNDLSIYADLVRSRATSGRKQLNIVLSLNKIWRKHELDKLHVNNFINIQYKAFLNCVLQNIGNYSTAVDTRQFILLTDFIQTIQHMESTIMVSEEFDDFYYKNEANMQLLLSQSDQFFVHLHSHHRQRMKELLEPLKEKTAHPYWKIWDEWEDGIYLYEKTQETGLPIIGVECTFVDVKGNPFHKLEIYISTWASKDWLSYEQYIMEEIGITPKVSDQKTYLLYETVYSQQDKEIIEALSGALQAKQRIVTAFKMDQISTT